MRVQVTPLFFVAKVHLKVLLRDLSFLCLLFLMPLLLHASLTLRKLPEEIYAYSISLALTVSAPIIVLSAAAFDARKILRLRDLPETIGFPALFLSNLMSVTPLLLPLIVAVRSLELAAIVAVSVATVLLIPYTPRAVLLPLPLLLVQEYEVSVLYAMPPAAVALSRSAIRHLRGAFICGITVFPHHIPLPLAAVIFASLPLIGSGKIYVVASGMGMLDPDFSKPALVIDAIVLQLLLVLFPFTSAQGAWISD